MKDFLLDVNGDLCFGKSDNIYNSLEFSFFTSNTQSFFLNFYIENYDIPNHLDGFTPEFILNFHLKEVKYDKDILLNESEEEYFQQQIKIRLDTSLKTLESNEHIGSNLDLYNHRLIKKDDKFEDIKQCIKEALNDILPNAQIEVTKLDTIYLDYSNSLMITIKNKKYNYYYYL